MAVQLARSRVHWQVAWSADEKMKLSRLCARSITLEHIMAHARPSATALKIIGADLRPNGRALLQRVWSLQEIPR